MSDSDIETAAELQAVFGGQRIVSVIAHADAEGGFNWLGFTLSNGEEIELSATGDHTQGWIYAERGRQSRILYGYIPSDEEDDGD